MTMCDKAVILQTIQRSRAELAAAKLAAEEMPRPINACASHDAIFRMSMAQAVAMDTVLLIKEEHLKDELFNTKSTEASTFSFSGFGQRIAASGPVARTLAWVCLVITIMLAVMMWQGKITRDTVKSAVDSAVLLGSQDSAKD